MIYVFEWSMRPPPLVLDWVGYDSETIATAYVQQGASLAGVIGERGAPGEKGDTGPIGPLSEWAFATLSELVSAAAPGVDQFPTGYVFNDVTVTNNGVYVWSGAGWSKSRGLPDQVAKLTVTGGTANAIIASAQAGVDPAVSILWFLTPSASSTGAVTVNGKPLKDRAGADLVSGALASGVPIAFVDVGTEYRVFLNSVSAIVDVVGLQSALDTKLAKTGGSVSGSLFMSEAIDIWMRSGTVDLAVVGWTRRTDDTFAGHVTHELGVGMVIKAVNSAGTVTNTLVVSDSTLGVMTLNGVQVLATSDIDTNTSLTANSDTKVPSQKAIKTYVDGLISTLKGGVSTAFDTLAELAANFANYLPLTGGTVTADIFVNSSKLVTEAALFTAIGAGAAQGGVGMTQLLAHGTAGTSLSYGTNYAGSALRLVSLIGDVSSVTAGVSATAPSGTWKSLGTVSGVAGKYSISNFVRVS